ncbi:hypothetical protein [Streptomyces cylindrosporus]|uniref:Uncharacterized protein n=1 Tax=Streptomyces cylindrosporus TaxID=2927583 RepID=A0ABS9YPE9_9ACTN|nr:hypothetical protein [Streptomyces cylindrosporus]MCI3279147.1 hypothetical protein [Streptomyces cylindrosporus]
MAKVNPTSPYTRLRQLPGGDRRLHVTAHGGTTSGYLAEASIAYTSDEVPTLHIELEESEHDLFSAGIDAVRIDIPADQILAADVAALRVDTPSSYAWQELSRQLETLKPWLSTEDPPPCGHEDVVETPEFANSQTPGICLWCPTPLVKLNDEWIPA